MGKTATLNLRVDPDVKENAESVLAQFLPKTASTVNAELMSAEEIHRKLEKGYADIEKGNVEDAISAFAAFRERH